MGKINYKYQKENVVSDFEEYFKLGQSKGYFVLDGKNIKYLAQGKKYNFSNLKEKVRAKYYFELIEKYKYPQEAIYFEVGVGQGISKKFVDIIVYNRDFKPYIVVDCKKGGISEAEFKQAIKQAVVKAKLLKAKFAVVVSGDIRQVIKINYYDNKILEKVIIIDIPIFYGKKKKPKRI